MLAKYGYTYIRYPEYELNTPTYVSLYLFTGCPNQWVYVSKTWIYIRYPEYEFNTPIYLYIYLQGVPINEFMLANMDIY